MKIATEYTILEDCIYEPGERWFSIETKISFIDKDELFYYDSPLSNFLAS